jgi:3'-phosphoadenosine 5'-phosphosulfate sulfotransferase (PAPS reductase)/FAD synthetase
MDAQLQSPVSLDLGFDDLFPSAIGYAASKQQPAIDLSVYEEFIVFFSGGKDSVACVLHLLDCGVEPQQIEIHHHLVDGDEGSTLMDWPVTESYCRAFAESFGVRYARSWRVGGFEREMLRENTSTAPVSVPMEDGVQSVSGGERSPPNTRRRFPQVTADLQQRWCSSSLKIEVGARYLNRNPRFADGKRRLVVTGERAEESKARATYATFELHRCHRAGHRITRRLDHWRPVHKWSEAQVWDILKRYGVRAHPVYDLGIGRASCAFCIFGGPQQWATLKEIDSERFDRIAGYERSFQITIHRSMSVNELAAKAVPLVVRSSPQALAVLRAQYQGDIRIAPALWQLPRGAFQHSPGPS